MAEVLEVKDVHLSPVFMYVFNNTSTESNISKLTLYLILVGNSSSSMRDFLYSLKETPYHANFAATSASAFYIPFHEGVLPLGRNIGYYFNISATCLSKVKVHLARKVKRYNGL